MKDLFPGYYHKPDLKKLFRDCLFVFDTSSLLALYKLPKNETLEAFEVLNDEKIVERLWIPYQVALEFQRNRFYKYNEQENENNVREHIGNVNKSIETLKKSIQERSLLQDQLLDADEAIKSLESAKSEIKKIKKKYKPNYLYEDFIREKIDQLFEGKIGRKYEDEELKEIYIEGEERYKNKIPPGYEDNKKKNDRKYGDLVIWKQIIEYAKSKNLCVVLVINDSKKDWWFEKEGPQAELVEEFLEETGQAFHIIDFPSFLIEANEKLDLGKDEETLKHIETLEDLDRAFNQIQNYFSVISKISDQSSRSIIWEPELIDQVYRNITIDPELLEKINRNITIDPELLEKINRNMTMDPELLEKINKRLNPDLEFLEIINRKSLEDNKKFWNSVKKDLEELKEKTDKNNEKQNESENEEN